MGRDCSQDMGGGAKPLLRPARISSSMYSTRTLINLLLGKKCVEKRPPWPKEVKITPCCHFRVSWLRSLGDNKPTKTICSSLRMCIFHRDHFRRHGNYHIFLQVVFLLMRSRRLGWRGRSWWPPARDWWGETLYVFLGVYGFGWDQNSLLPGPHWSWKPGMWEQYR